MNKLPPELTFVDNAVPFAQLCIDATFYWRGSMHDHGASLTAAYRHALTAVESDLVYFETGSMAGAKKLKADSLSMVPFWAEKAKRREDIYIMHLKAGNTADEPTDRALYFMADEEDDPPVGALKLSLPVSCADRPEQVLQTVLAVAGDADFESGHCGYSLAWDDRGDGAPDALARMHHLAGRYLGVDLYKVNTTLRAMQLSDAPGIKVVNWLTLLGGTLVKRLGGAQAVRDAIGTSCVLYNVGAGLLVRAGEAPTLGDRNRKDDVSAFRDVGQALASVRFRNHGRIFGSPTAGDGDSTQTWLARFDN